MPDEISAQLEYFSVTSAEGTVDLLNRQLQELPKSLANKGARKATRAVAKATLEDARALAPHDTGRLERSLRVRARKRSRRNKGTVGHSVTTSSTHLFKGDEFYAGFVELGTEKMEADPFLRPALWGNRQRKLQIFINILRAWLTKDAPQVMRQIGRQALEEAAEEAIG